MIRVDSLTLGYDGRPVLSGVTGRIEDGCLLAVAGPNGGGKTTLVKALAGKLRPMAGAIAFERIHRKDIAYLPQAGALDRSFPMSVFDLVAAGAWRAAGVLGGFGRRRLHAVQKAIDAVGLTGRENAAIGALSGGQLQRALFARAMVQDAKLMLLDEPFAAVDEATQADLTALMLAWRAEGRSIVAVMHDLDLILRVFPETLLLGGRQIAWGPSDSALSAENLALARAAVAGRPAAAAA